MTTLESRVQVAAKRNGELITTLTDTDYASSAVAQQNAFIKDLKGTIAAVDKQVKKLTLDREKEFKDHEKYRDSFVRRIAHRAVGKKDDFAAKAEKEEREYFDALREETLAKDQRENLGQQLKEAEAHLAELEPVAKQHDDAQKELDELYESLFSGPTPAFPDEDTAEQAARDAQEKYRQRRKVWEAEHQAAERLNAASVQMGRAVDSMDDARSYSRRDMMGGGTFTDMMERDALSTAQNYVNRAHSHLEQAMRASDQVRPPPDMHVEQGHVWSDMVFDNIFSDMAMHDRIKESQAQVQAGAAHVRRETQEAERRVHDVRAELRGLEKTLLQARQDLQKVRMTTFEKVLQGGSMPPAYEETSAAKA